jgi:hypothetical protein
MLSNWEKKKILMFVKTYPNPSKKYRETVCTAGITDEGKLIRLYPIAFRFLEESKQFEKYRWIEAEVLKNKEDARPESYKINYDSIKLLNKLDATKNADERRKIIEPLITESLEKIIQKQEIDGTSLGIFKPKEIRDLRIQEVENPDWSKRDMIILSQSSIYDKEANKQILEKMPVDISFSFTCKGDDCKGHTMKITDWELCQTYRNFAGKYGMAEGIEKTKEKWLSKFNDRNSDAYFVVGTVHRFKTFILLGVINLKKATQISFLALV